MLTRAKTAELVSADIDPGGSAGHSDSSFCVEANRISAVAARVDKRRGCGDGDSRGGLRRAPLRSRRCEL